MRVMINCQSIELFHGATLKHALLKADETLYHDVRQGRAIIKDKEGNLTDINGSVADGWRYVVDYPRTDKI